MGFLDNSGDIILDAVLTDLGRKRLAEGNGRFKITKFALGDDEIDYGLYDKTHLLFLPVILTNTDLQPFLSGLSSYVVLVDETTVDALTPTNGSSLDNGLLNGYRPDQGARFVAADQGLDTLEVSNQQTLADVDSTLVETQYFVQIDNRLGQLRNRGAATGQATVGLQPSSVDDDNIATYIFSANDDTGIISSPGAGAASSINGPLGTRVQFKIASSLDLRTSTFLFNQLGSSGTANITSGTATLLAADYRFIDSTVRISGVSTGYTLDVPVRFVKKTS